MGINSEKVRRLRGARHWSVRELAKRAGISHVEVLRIEGGAREGSVDTLQALAQALQVPVATLLRPRKRTRPRGR